ncbi:restriction endonuclease subunit S [Megasphaera sp. DISK 18]|uniref:restriction endonuclease subunit S n=1 Tax=Megasphaera sp. DISK 18 TaxID=1776081 RepID=UPI000806F6F4|nr:restriction endonuclease subunit S [Megasphaera sp. DISK 18]
MKQVLLNDVGEVTKLAGFEFTKYMEYIPDGEIIAIRALNLKDGCLQLDDVKKISRHVADVLPRSQLHVNDIVLSYTGTLGECAQIREEGKYHLAPNVAKITPRKNIDPDYLFQIIRSKEFKNEVMNYSHGSTQRTIPMKIIRGLPIKILPLDQQHKVASILKNLDEKIEINKYINKNLEEQLNAFYNKTFIIDADPTWKKGMLSELIEVCYGKNHNKLAAGNVPVYGSGGIMRYVDKCLYDQESVLIPRKGTLNNIIYINEPFWSVDTMFYTKMRHSNTAKFIFHFLRTKDMEAMNTGSAVPSMTTKILNAIQLAIPDEKTLKAFENQVQPYYRLIAENNKESKVLSSMRDSLLPKLISGNINISHITI